MIQQEAIQRLVHWLEYESTKRYGAARTHDLHIWDWEVDALLAQLVERAK